MDPLKMDRPSQLFSTDAMESNLQSFLLNSTKDISLEPSFLIQFDQENQEEDKCLFLHLKKVMNLRSIIGQELTNFSFLWTSRRE